MKLTSHMIVLVTLALTCSANAWETLPTTAGPTAEPASQEMIELGKQLFFDPRLSLTGTVSCNTCHNLMEGGDDGRETSMGIHGRTGPRNAPTVWNSVFQGSQFWDGRAATLEEQAQGPIVAAPEMGMPDHNHALQRIAKIPGYQASFQSVFGSENALTLENAVNAIAAFERTLITPHSDFDRYLDGEEHAMNAQQIAGMGRFESVGCTECHDGPALNGWQPGDVESVFQEFPRSMDSGLVDRYQLAADLGRFAVTQAESDKHLFKVPTLRNILLTAPYFHHGRVSTIHEAIDVMAQTQLDTELSGAEIAEIAAFFAALDGRFPELPLPRLPSRAGESVIDEPEVLDE
ncbi:cytochrome-c peroxidase [Novipirellula artificiosorum]|uniref:Methylamine utilization protein MauG n=1 Tax=Novipirellula artificiosorum TaxID=2528016 RepID=A0A5C6E153_9BACT|nr:cytochrome c peroxidase [Novipirellula artificiosorum]TWU42612.1 Cytochrome c551 peroxidase precursor [Novipirellula artificiosorum]